MDILYVHPGKQETDARYDQYVCGSSYPFIPVGLPGLVNLLRDAGWSVRGLNLPLELTLEPTFSVQRWLAEHSAPRMALVDLHWYEHCYGAMEVVSAIKAAWPRVPVVLGGLTATCFATEIVAEWPNVDYVIQGDAEIPLQQLAERCCASVSTPLAEIANLVYRRDDGVEQNPVTYTADTEMLDRLDGVSMDWLEHWRSYAAVQYSGSGDIDLHEHSHQGHWLLVGRGCTFNCIYCGGCQTAHRRLAGREGFVMRSPEAVLDDVERLQARGVEQIALSLDIACFEPGWWQTFFAGMHERGIRIGLYNEFFQLPSAAFIRAMADVVDREHTELALSPLSGHEGVRHQNGKFFNDQRLARTISLLKQHRLPIFVYFSLNLPGETPKTFQRTLRLAERIGRQYPDDLLRMLNTCHTLDPASPMSDGESGRRAEDHTDPDIAVHYQTFRDYYTYCQGTRWQPRFVTRGQHRGFEMEGRPAETVEQMAREWDAFAESQSFRCYPVPRGW